MISAAMGKTVKSQLIGLVVLSVGIRLLIAPLFGGFQYDMNSLADWSWHLQFTPMNRFYEFANNPDHLPGDLWFLWWLGTIFRAFGGINFESDSYHFLIKLVPTIADAGIGVLIFAIVSSIRSSRDALIAAASYLLNPAVIYLTAVWGQWDSVSMALVLAAMWIVLSKKWWLWAAPVLAWAVVIKPPLVPLAGLVLLIPIWRDYISTGLTVAWIRRTFGATLIVVVVTWISVLAVILPFGVGLPGTTTTWKLLDRLQVALDLYPSKTLAAMNIWMLGQASLDRVDDESTLIFGQSSHSVGNILLVLALMCIVGTALLLAVRRVPFSLPIVITWLMLLASFSFYMLPTRVHERYLFPSLVCLALLVGLGRTERSFLVLYACLSTTYLFNLMIVYGGFRDSVPELVGDFIYSPFLVVLTLVNTACFVFAVWITYRRLVLPIDGDIMFRTPAPVNHLVR